MGISKITERQVIGWLYHALSVDSGMSWIGDVANYFESDQAMEEYPFISMVPAMREWVGGRNAKGFSENTIEVKNKVFEATIELLEDWIRRDKTDQIQVRIGELAERSNSHWASLLSTLIINGPSTTCYDGQYFFDTDHSEGSSGTQSNDITVDISTMPVATAGTVTNPAVAEAQWSIMKGILAILGFKDDQGEPRNEDAKSFLVMTPLALYPNFAQAVQTPMQVAETQTALVAMQQDFSIRVVPNLRLDSDGSWTDEFVVFRTDAKLKSFIQQQEYGPRSRSKWLDSEYCFDNRKVQVGIDASRNVAYGHWQNSCLVTMT